MEKFLLFLMHGIPELIANTTFCLALAGVPLKWKKIIPIAVVMTVSIYLIRIIQTHFGVHTLIAALLLTIILSKTTNIGVKKAFTFSMVTFATIIIVEYICVQTIFTVTGLTVSIIGENELLWKLITLPQVGVMFLLAFLTTKIKKKKSYGEWTV